MKLLQIQDNGSGIKKDDMPIVCERFTTSKLKDFTDLQTIQTFGFRGEALASVSYVSKLTIISHTKDDRCSWKGTYVDSRLTDPLKPCAGNQGTLISVENLFYNVPTRRKVLKSPNEEYSRIYEVVTHYAINYPGVGFSLKKDDSIDFSSPPNSTATDVIQVIYGSNVVKELLAVECSDDILKFTASGYASNANYQHKKCIFILFINNRLVESTALKKALEAVYFQILPKGTHPFIFLKLSIHPQHVDVNVHPTKHEVHFLHEESIIEKVQKEVECKVTNSNITKTYLTQKPLLIQVQGEKEKLQKNEAVDSTKPALSACRMVRTDAKDQKLDKFFIKEKVEDNSDMSGSMSCDNDVERRTITLSSILSLRNQVKISCNTDIQEVLEKHTFVGCVSPKHSLIQYSTKLYLVNMTVLSEELFYQILLEDFGNFGIINFSEPLSIYDVAMLGLSLEDSGWSESDGPKEELALYVVNLLKAKAVMLDDYFSLKVDQNGNICTLPYILDKYVPSMADLPMYIIRLATEVEWDSEVECFESFCRETAKFYSVKQSIIDEGTLKEGDKENDWKWKVEHLVFPALRRNFQPPQYFAHNTCILQIADLPQLYTVFERC